MMKFHLLCNGPIATNSAKGVVCAAKEKRIEQ